MLRTHDDGASVAFCKSKPKPDYDNGRKGAVMKKDIILPFMAVAILLSGCSKHNAEANYFSPGQFWYDDSGALINAHGGGILSYRNTYYWYGEYKSDTTSNAMTGVSCYSSQDLYTWHNEGIVLPVSDSPESDIQRGCILERPKVIYNESTGNFVMYFHLELKGQGYSAARVGIAVSETPTGPFTFIRSLRPNADILPLNMPSDAGLVKDEGHYECWSAEWVAAVRQGLFTWRDLHTGQMSRDMALYVDDDGKAYHIYASEENLTLQIAELTPDYLGYTGKYKRIQPAGHNEAPALFKKAGKYYMITSGCTGWAPNAARLLTADSLMGEWTLHENPCVGADADLTFHSQSTFVLPIEGKHNAFIFMADRWKPEKHTEGTYIWLPVQFGADGMPYLEWKDNWDLSVFK